MYDNGGGGSVQGIGGGIGTGGGSPATGPSIRGIGPGGLPIRKKVYPKKEPRRLKEIIGYKKSFAKFSSKGKKVT